MKKNKILDEAVKKMEKEVDEVYVGLYIQLCIHMHINLLSCLYCTC